MSYDSFYRRLLRPLVRRLGAEDPATRVPLIGFDAGGPLSFVRFGECSYVSCELAVRKEQKPSSWGRYELMATCADEEWVREIVTAVGRMGFDARLDATHTIDIGPLVGRRERIQAVLLDRIRRATIAGRRHSVLRCTGITRRELELARAHGGVALDRRLRTAGIEATILGRESII